MHCHCWGSSVSESVVLTASNCMHKVCLNIIFDSMQWMNECSDHSALKPIILLPVTRNMKEKGEMSRDTFTQQRRFHLHLQNDWNQLLIYVHCQLSRELLNTMYTYMNLGLSSEFLHHRVATLRKTKASPLKQQITFDILGTYKKRRHCGLSSSSWQITDYHWSYSVLTDFSMSP